MNTAIIVGAGKGKRMGSKINKILLTLSGKPIICYTIEKFEDCAGIGQIILVVNKEDLNDIDELVKKYSYTKIIKIVEGGEHRQDSVYNGIRAIKDGKREDIIVVHNAANPFVSKKTISEAIENAMEFGAAAVAFKAKDTIKKVNRYGFVDKTLNREELWQMQTPQAIEYSLAVRAFVNAYNDNFYGTDDVSLVERIGHRIKIIESNIDNIKITNTDDMDFSNTLFSNSRVGLGQDSHRFANDEKLLFLGGVLIENENGLEANSDGDVVLHALCNALSQAVGGRSLGYYADSLFKKGVIDSKEYLKVFLKMVGDNEYKINNAGIMIEAKKPRLENYEEKIKESIANLIGVEKEKVGLAATSGEELSDFGRGLGIQCFAIVSLTKTN